MGCSCDWSRLRFKLDDVCARAVRETFFALFQEGKIYRGKRLVNWDTYLQTAVSDDEVFHDPVKGHFWHFRYPVVDPKPGEPTHITIATTRPETMLGDTAVAVHPDPAAALSRAEKELRRRLSEAPTKEKPDIQKQIDEIERRRGEMLPALEKLRDMAHEGRMLELPLTGREIPLIADEWAKPELGSGCVKITPAHDQNDYDVWQRNLEIGAINILNPDGTLNDNVPEPYRGLAVLKARKAVVADLEAAKLVVEIEDREIDLAHSDRSKTPIEPYLADQWFIKMDELAQTAMDAVADGRVKIIPERYAKGYTDWLSEKRDWPIGRQLWWGHRIPVWTRQDWDHRNASEEMKAFSRQLTKWDGENRITMQKGVVEHQENDVVNNSRGLTAPGEAGCSSNTFRGLLAPGYCDTVHANQNDFFICVRDENDAKIIEEIEARGFIRDTDVLDTCSVRLCGRFRRSAGRSKPRN